MQLTETIKEARLGEINGQIRVVAVKGECKARDIQQVKGGIWSDIKFSESDSPIQSALEGER